MKCLPTYKGTRYESLTAVKAAIIKDLDLEGKVREMPGITRYYDEPMSEAQLNNKILDIGLAVLNNDQHVEELLAPLSSDMLAKYLKSDKFKKAREFDHVNSMHTNIYQEYINKFAKQAVGITATYITGQTMYDKAGIRTKGLSILNVLSDYEEVGVHRLGVEKNADGELVSDILKVWNNAALDNAKDPILGYLNVNSLTINSALLLTSLGYKLDTIINFINQPVIKRLSELQAKDPTMTITKLVNLLIAESSADLGQSYNLAKEADSSQFSLTAENLDSLAGKQLNEIQVDDQFLQGEVLALFEETVEAGMDLGKVNKVLSPETAKNLSTFAALEEFNQNINYLNSNETRVRIDPDIFTRNSELATPEERIAASPLPRVTAFYERGLQAAYNFGKGMFAYNSEAYEFVKAELAEKLGVRNYILNADQINTINAHLGQLALTDDGKLANLLAGIDFKTMLFDKDKSLAKILESMKDADPDLAKNALIKNLSASAVNKFSITQHVYYNNTSDRSIEDKNNMTQGWLSLIQSANPKHQKLGKALVAYSVLTSGFQTSPGSFFDLIPTEYWESSGMVEAWEDVQDKLRDPLFMSDSAEVVIRRGFQDLVAPLKGIINSNGDIAFSSLENVKTENVLNDKGEAFQKNKDGKYNQAIKEFTIDLLHNSDARVQGLAGNAVAKQYLKIYHPVKRRTSKGGSQRIKTMSGWRLYKLTDQNKTKATYTEIQPLGEKGQFQEGSNNNPKQKSTYKKWKGRPVPQGNTYAMLEPVETLRDDRLTISRDLETSLRSFLTNIGVRVEALESLKDKFGVKAQGLADLTNSIVYLLNTDEGLKALPEETAHFFVEGLADHKLLKELIDQVEGTPEYAEVKERYSELYGYDTLKLKKEAAAKLIAKHLIKSEPVPKNWLRRLLDKIKDLINSVFKGKDPYQTAARYILENNTEVMNAAPASTGIMYALDPDQDFEGPLVPEDFEQKILNEDKGLFYEDDFELKEAQRIAGFETSTLSIKSIENLQMAFNDQAAEVAKIIDKIRKGVEVKLKKIKRMGQEVPDMLGDLHDSLNKLEGMKFLQDLSKGALDAVETTAEQVLAYDFKEASPEKALGFIHRMELQLGTFSHLKELKQVLREKYREEKDPDLLEIIKSVGSAAEAIQDNLGDLNELRKKSFGEWMKTISSREWPEGELEKVLDEIVTETGFMDSQAMSLSDSHDEILSAMGKKVKMMEAKAHEQFSNYLRGTEDNPGLSQVAADLQKYKGTTDLEKLYEDFIEWDPTTGKYKFIVDPTEIYGALRKDEKASTFMTEKWNKLQALPDDNPVKRYYKFAVEPYLEARRKLIKQNMKSVIGDFNNVPVRRKRSTELSLGSVDWAKTKLKNLKDELRIVADDEFIGAVDETGRPINFVPYRYNFAGDLQKEDLSMEISNGLAMAMENIYQANEKRDALPLIEAAEKILASREFVERDEKTGSWKILDKKSGTASASYKKYKELTQVLIFGEEDDTTKIGKVDLRKTTRAVKSSLSYLNLGFNAASQIVNPIVQAYMVLNEGIGGRDYTLKDLRKGYAKASKKMAGMMADYHSKNPKSRDTLLMERLGVFSHGLEEINLGKKGNFINNFFVKLGYAGFKAGNAMVQPGVAYAMMNRKKIKLKSGKEITFDEAFEMKNGSLVMNEEAEAAMGGPDQVALFIAQVQNAVRKISDNRALSDKGAAETHWYGKFIMMHRGWMVPMFVNMWENGHFHETTGRWEEGSLNTASRALWKVFSKENVLQLKNLAFQFDNLTTGDINPSTGKPFTEDQLGLFKANIKKVVSMIYTFGLIQALKAIAWDDEEEKDSYTYYLTLRARAEIFSMANPQDMLRILKSPSAAVNNMTNLLDALGYTVMPHEGLERIERGPYEDWTKIGRAWSRFVPVYNQYMNLQKTADKIKFMER